MAHTPPCVYYKYGHCKFQNLCKNNHIHELCDIEDCDGKTCVRRHPKQCRYFLTYGKCKFNPCSYSHRNSPEHEKLKRLEITVDDMKREINELKEALKLNTAQMLKDMDMKLLQFASNQPPQHALKADLRSTRYQNGSACLSTASRTSSIVTTTPTAPVPFWTTRGNSCCYHECQPDDKPPGKCCYHRCRELWD